MICASSSASRLSAGRSDAEIRDFLVARYGQFVLLRPRFGLETLLLWLGPFLVLAVGAVVIGVAARRRSTASMRRFPTRSRARLASLEAQPHRDGREARLIRGFERGLPRPSVNLAGAACVCAAGSARVLAQAMLDTCSPITNISCKRQDSATGDDPICKAQGDLGIAQVTRSLNHEYATTSVRRRRGAGG